MAKAPKTAPQAKLLEKDPTELHENFAEWITEQTGYEVDLRSVQLATVLRMQFQRSDANQQHLAARRQAAEAREAAKAERAETRAAKKAEPKAEKPAKKTATKKAAPAKKTAVAKKATPAPATKAAAPKRRRKAAAASSAEETF